MQKPRHDVPRAHRTARWRLVAAAGVAAACFGAHWGWLGWDMTYQVDPATGATSGPYEPWQVVGCALSLVLTAAIAGFLRQAMVAMVVLPVAYTLAWSIPARAADYTGLWAVGAALVLMATVAGVCVVAPLALLARHLLARVLRTPETS